MGNEQYPGDARAARRRVNPVIASLIFGCGILGLFWLNRDPSIQTSKALWIPVTWFLIVGSRAPSTWFQSPSPLSVGDQYLEGNPFERNLFSAILILALCVLFTRRQEIGKILTRNAPILLFISYCAISLLWSDYPGVGFKRWTKLVGDLAMVLIVVTDIDPNAAFDRLITRTGFLIVPISILFIRYFPELGRSYDGWSGAMHWTGVTTNKNTLGLICMIIGLGTLWRVARAFRSKKSKGRTRALTAHGTILLMVMYLLYEANSATSTSCFVLAGALIVAITSFRFARRPLAVQALALGILLLAASTAFFNVAGLVEQLGRNPDLTGRTTLWSIVLSQPVSRVFGAGYESFWLGDRLATIERLSGQTPNQSHDGYIEILVNLGWIGVTLLAFVIVTGYSKIIRAVRLDPETNCRMLAYFIAALIYNFTEAAFKMTDAVWICFVWSIVAASNATRVKNLTVMNVPGTSLTDGSVRGTGQRERLTAGGNGKPSRRPVGRALYGAS
jgi:O-antigen ligase